MNIFGIGPAELVLIFLIALVVAGPQRMMLWAYHAGRFVGRLRKYWEEFAAVIEAEAREAGIDVKVPRQPPTRQTIDRSIRQTIQPYTQDIQKLADDVRAPLEETTRQAQEALKTTWGTTNPQPAQPVNTVKAAPPASQAAFGTWGAPDEANQQEKPSNTGVSLGTWSVAQQSSQAREK